MKGVIAKRSFCKPVAGLKSFNRKEFEKKRSAQIKDNFNKIVVIGNAEIKEYKDLFTKLDTEHREYFKNMFNKDNKDKDKNNTLMSSDDEEEDVVNVFIED